MKTYFFLFLLFSTIHLFADQDIKIIKSDKTSLIIQYNPRLIDSSRISINGTEYRKLSFRGGYIPPDSNYSQPQIEVRTFNIGVPQEIGNTIEVIGFNYTEIDGRIIPKPKQIYKDNSIISEYEVNSNYNTQTNNNLIEFGEFVVIRNMPVQKLNIRPIEFDANTSKIKLYTSITVKVNFAREQKHFIQEYTDDLLKDVVLNYDAAKDWIESKPTSLSKSAVTSSVLSSGRFFRFEAPEEGIYRIDRAALASLGIDAGSVDPRTIKIYNNGGKAPVPENMFQSRSADLTENAIYVRGEEDGKFDEGDYILFYGRGVHFWDYDTTEKQVKRYFHPFTTKNYYYITSGGNSGKRIEQKPGIEAAADFQQNTTKAYYAKEDDLVNLLKSGRKYLGDMFTESAKSKERVYMTKLDGLVENSTLEYQFEFVNASEKAALLEIWENQLKIYSKSINGVGNSDYEKAKILKGQASTIITLPENRSSLKFVYNVTHSPSQGFLDYYEIYYDKYMTAVTDEIKFYSKEENAGIVEYMLNGFVNNTAEVKVFDVSDYANIKMITGAMISGGEYRFKVTESSDKISKYIAAGETALKKITGIEEVQNQNLHGIADGGKFIIITHKNFLEEARRLKTHKETKTNDPLSTVVVTVDQIFHEFSTTGSQDVSAIRDFIKYAFDNWTIKPEYILLFGDGDYDYKNTEGISQNFILPYESVNWYNTVDSYSSDDFYTRISGNGSSVDIAIGRLNVISSADAKAVVDKIISYETKNEYGTWHNQVALVADDMRVTNGSDNINHISSSENLNRSCLPGFFSIRKIYLAQYPSIELGSGRRLPAVNKAIVDAVNEGVLIINYYGHGNPDVWAHEHVFEKSTTIPQLKNDKLFFLTALTCDFGRYDIPGEQSSTELLVLKLNSGAIAIISASKSTHPWDNENMNKNFYSFLFNTNNPYEKPSLGKAYFQTKHNGTQSDDEKKYHLFGDPTIKLNMAEMKASIEAINNSPLTDTSEINLKALSTVKIDGTIKNNSGNIAEDFNGEGILTVYDSERKVKASESNTMIIMQGGILSKSRVSIQNGKFTSEFTVPKDISYENKNGKIVIYADNEITDAVGYTSNVVIGGTDTTKVNDGSGPEIEISFDDEFNDGINLITGNSKLQVKLKDETGLNTTGSGIGHKMEGILNDNENEALDFTDYFLGDLNSGGKSGIINYPFNGIKEGEYKLKVKAWDVFNNSSEEFSYFSVVSDEELVIRDVFNYPNPFSSNTSFTFFHNMTSSINVKIKIYTIAGRLIKIIDQRAIDYKNVKIDWDGRDEDGNLLANGTYLYKLIVSANDGKYRKELLGKLAVIR